MIETNVNADLIIVFLFNFKLFNYKLLTVQLKVINNLITSY